MFTLASLPDLPWSAAYAAAGRAWKSSWRVINAQPIRAILLARATAATLRGLVASSLASQGREIRFFRCDRAGYLLTVIVPLIAFAVLTWTFSSAVVRGLDIVVVDADRSQVSSKLIQSIAAAQGFSVAERANDLKSATGAIRSGAAIAAVYIPPRFEEDLLAVRRPQIIAFYNAQYFTPGNIASRGLSDAISDAVSQLSPLRGVRLPSVGSGSLVVEQYVLTNPALNYTGFLQRAVMPTTLHVIIGIATAYAIGTEFSRRSRRAWLRSPAAAH